jgi:hypothetical protein
VDVIMRRLNRDDEYDNKYDDDGAILLLVNEEDDDIIIEGRRWRMEEDVENDIAMAMRRDDRANRATHHNHAKRRKHSVLEGLGGR